MHLTLILDVGWCSTFEKEMRVQTFLQGGGLLLFPTPDPPPHNNLNLSLQYLVLFYFFLYSQILQLSRVIL